MQTLVLEDGVTLFLLQCPICGHPLAWVSMGSVIQLKCWRQDCSKPTLRFPPRYFEIVKSEQKNNSGALSAVTT